MGTVQAGASGSAGSLRAVCHDLRSGLAAATAYLDLARERVARGEPLEDEDLARMERSLELIHATLQRLEAIAKGAPP